VQATQQQRSQSPFSTHQQQVNFDQQPLFSNIMTAPANQSFHVNGAAPQQPNNLANGVYNVATISQNFPDLKQTM
jgi:hypothetical protein